MLSESYGRGYIYVVIVTLYAQQPLCKNAQSLRVSEFIVHSKNAKLWTGIVTPLAHQPQQEQTRGFFYSIKKESEK